MSKSRKVYIAVIGKPNVPIEGITATFLEFQDCPVLLQDKAFKQPYVFNHILLSCVFRDLPDYEKRLYGWHASISSTFC